MLPLYNDTIAGNAFIYIAYFYIRYLCLILLIYIRYIAHSI